MGLNDRASEQVVAAELAIEADRRTDERTDERTDGRAGGRTDGRADGRAGGWAYFFEAWKSYTKFLKNCIFVRTRNRTRN